MTGKVRVDWHSLKHACMPPKGQRIEGCLYVRFDWRCPVCGQRWTVDAGWRAFRHGSPSRRWRKREARRIEADRGVR